MTDGPVLQRTLKTSFIQLWKHSPLWRFTLIGAGVAAALFLINPPWQEEVQRAPQLALPAPAVANHDKLVMPAPVPKLATDATIPVNTRAAHNPDSARLHNNQLQEKPRKYVAHEPAATPAPPPGISAKIIEADQHCNDAGPMLMPLNPSLPAHGRIIAFLSPSQALSLIQVSEQAANGKIDPQYIQNLRVIIRPDDVPSSTHVTALIPMGMNAYVGEQVQFVGGHASPDLACHYIPNLVMEEPTQ